MSLEPGKLRKAVAGTESEPAETAEPRARPRPENFRGGPSFFAKTARYFKWMGSTDLGVLVSTCFDYCNLCIVLNVAVYA